MTLLILTFICIVSACCTSPILCYQNTFWWTYSCAYEAAGICGVCLPSLSGGAIAIIVTIILVIISSIIACCCCCCSCCPYNQYLERKKAAQFQMTHPPYAYQKIEREPPSYKDADAELPKVVVTCSNCNTEMTGMFCSNCGKQNTE